MHFHRLLIVHLLLLIPGSAAFGHPHTDRGNDKPYLVREFKVEKPGMLRSNTPAGNIEVRTVAGSEKVRVELYIDWGYALWSNSKNLDNYRITVIEREGEVIAAVERKSPGTGFFKNRIRFNFKLYIPEDFSTDLSNSNGDVYLSGVRGKQSVKTNGGKIELTGVEGRVNAWASAGNIDIRDSRGRIFAQSNAGRISVNRSGGELRLKAVGGSINSEQIEGTLLAQSDVGNVNVHFNRVTSGISIQSITGNIFVSIPKSGGYDLHLRGATLDLKDAGDFVGKIDRGRAEGTIKGGGKPVELTTQMGTVTVKTDDE